MPMPPNPYDAASDKPSQQYAEAKRQAGGRKPEPPTFARYVAHRGERAVAFQFADLADLLKPRLQRISQVLPFGREADEVFVCRDEEGQRLFRMLQRFGRCRQEALHALAIRRRTFQAFDGGLQRIQFAFRRGRVRRYTPRRGSGWPRRRRPARLPANEWRLSRSQAPRFPRRSAAGMAEAIVSSSVMSLLNCAVAARRPAMVSIVAAEAAWYSNSAYHGGSATADTPLFQPALKILESAPAFGELRQRFPRLRLNRRRFRLPRSAARSSARRSPW